MTGNVVELFRYPVKGLRPEALAQTRLKKDLGVEGDRAFAFQFLDDSVPAELREAPADAAPWMSKAHLAVQHDWPELARIVPHWNDTARTLRLTVGNDTIEAPLDAAGRERLAAFVHAFLATLTPYPKARHPEPSEVRLVGNSDVSTIYTDSANGFVSFALMETYTDLERAFGGPIDRRRLRLNLHLDGAPAWSELNWIGKDLCIGDTRLEIVRPIGRCPNIDVDPDTGARCPEMFPRLKSTFGHSMFGVRGKVVAGGTIRVGDTWRLVERGEP